MSNNGYTLRGEVIYKQMKFVVGNKSPKTLARNSTRGSLQELYEVSSEIPNQSRNFDKLRSKLEKAIELMS